MQESANRLLPVAKVIKSFGTDGGVILRVASGMLSKINKKGPVFIYYDGLPVPFFISVMEQKGSEKFFVKFDGIDSPALSSEIEGEFVYTEPVKSKKDSKKGEEDFSPEMLVGIDVYDSKGSRTGKILSFYDYPGNPCIGLSVEPSYKEVLIPLHGDFILSVEIENNKIVMNLPSGLLDL
jgi:16S rRNA processing protein RimM